VSWRSRIDIEYDGSDFAGWQIQPNLPTVQGALEKALLQLYGRPVRLYGAGRTDAGVHAKGQVAHALIPNRRYDALRLVEGLNALTPDAVVVHGVSEVDSGFDARRSALYRDYLYRLSRSRVAYGRQFVWSVTRPLALRALRQCAAALPGTHRFTSFCVAASAGRGTECHVMEARWQTSDHEWQFHIRANRYVHGMVRSLVGTMVEVGVGKMTVEQFCELLSRPSRKKSGQRAPARGLCLVAIKYPATETS
jgi:tRNA pseudouridine38-40 synthase